MIKLHISRISIFILLFCCLLSTQSGKAQYCMPSFTNYCSPPPALADFIDNFSTSGGLTNITNNASGCNGTFPNNYTYNASMTVSQIQGQSFNVSMQCGPLFSQGFRIWVDYNNDFDFSDPGEDVYASPSSGTGVFTGTITIPIATTPGTKRMRVLCRYVTVPTVSDFCGTGFSFGECEDYNLNVIAATPCTGTPTAGTAVASATNLCPGTVFSVSLTGSSMSGGLAYQWLRGTNCTGPWMPISGVVNPTALTPTFVDTALGGATFGYRCRITCTFTGLSDTSTAACVAVLPYSCTSTCFGSSAATSSADQDIWNVTVGSLNNTTDCISPLAGSQGAGTGTASMYANFTGTGGVPAPNVYKGLAQPFSITVGTCGASVASSVKMYIDYNHNNSFIDPGEEVYTNPSVASVSPAAVLTGTFTTPTTALSGCTRLRVVMMSTWIGVVQPTGTYGFGETEDYSINIIQPSPSDPAVSAIIVPPGTCFTHNETVTVNLCNYGSSPINLSTNPVTVNLLVNGPSGVVSYPMTASSGVLSPYGAACVPLTFTGVDMYAGGAYSINTSLSIAGLSNGNLINDSLNSPITRPNYRPTGNPYQMCQGDIIPFGQGLTVGGCATPVLDSFTVNFALASSTSIPCLPSSVLYTGACLVGTTTVPILPPGSTLLSGELRATNLATANGGWALETRFPLFNGSMPVTTTNILYPSSQGHPATSSANYTWLNNLNSSQITNVYNGALLTAGTLNVGYHSTWTGNATSNGLTLNAGGNPTIISLKVRYTYVPASFEWYNVPVGGTVLYNYSPYNPIGAPGSGITNSNTPGITTFYAACAGSSDCRIAVDLVINPVPAVLQDSMYACEYAVGSYAGVFDLNTISGFVSAFSPDDTVSYFGDQALFIPITYPSADTTSTVFIYSKVTDTLTGCFSSDSVYLDVSPIPQFTLPVFTGFACAPNAVDISSVINLFTIAPIDTFYFDDPLFTVNYSANPHLITTVDTIYAIIKTNNAVSCSDSAIVYIDVLPATNEIVNQAPGNFTICSPIPCGNITLTDGATETLYTTTDCRRIATVKDSLDGTHLGSTSICEEIVCASAPIHNGQPFVSRVYEITPTQNGRATVCLYYLDQDFGDYNNLAFPTWPFMMPDSNLCITKLEGGALGSPGTTAISIPNADITTSYDPLTTVWTICFPVDSFSTFYCHTCNPGNAALPVSLTHFTGVREGTHHVLNWETESEVNNSHFVLERSANGNSFTAISGHIPSKSVQGQSAVPLQYQFVDVKPMSGYNYYRLQQVDLDGRTTNSQVISLFAGENYNISIYPNPVKDDLTVSCYAESGQTIHIKLLDATGKVVFKQSYYCEHGTNSMQIPTNSLSLGIYLVQVTDDREMNYTQLVRKQ